MSSLAVEPLLLVSNKIDKFKQKRFKYGVNGSSGSRIFRKRPKKNKKKKKENLTLLERAIHAPNIVKIQLNLPLNVQPGR